MMNIEEPTNQQKNQEEFINQQKMRISYSDHDIENKMENGIIQIIHGQRIPQQAGQWMVTRISFLVRLKAAPLVWAWKDLSDNVMLSTGLDWNKINQRVVEEYEAERLTSHDLKNFKVFDLLFKLGVITHADNGVISVNDNYRYIYTEVSQDDDD